MSIRISVVLCTHNRIGSLRRAVDALFRIETTHSWELVIVDNGSSDGTKDFLASLPKHFSNAKLVTMFEAKCGLGAAQNLGWRTAQGSIVTFTHDDCYVRPDFLDQIDKVFTENSEIGFVAGRVLLYDESDLRICILEACERAYIPPRQFVPAGIIMGANLAFRRSTLERIGGFDEAFGPGTAFNAEDIEAVAAAVWSGISGVYDPRPTVYHHHGRKSALDAEKLRRTYDWGRGAYFAKYILNRETRTVYAKAWARLALARAARSILGLLHFRYIAPVKRTRRELWGALSYVLNQ